MNKQEIKIAVLILGLMALAAVLLASGRQRLGTPALRVEPMAITNELGKVVGTNRVSLPERVAGYRQDDMPVFDLEVNWLPHDTTFGRKLYRAEDGFGAMISVVLMGADRTSIHKPQYCLTGQGWRIEQTEVISIPMSRPRAYELKAMKLTTSKQGKDAQGNPVFAKGVYIYWFVADGQLTPHHGERMWWMARDMLKSGVLQRWAYVTCFSTCQPGQEDALTARMKRFLAETVPDFQLTPGADNKPLSTVSADR